MFADLYYPRSENGQSSLNTTQTTSAVGCMWICMVYAMRWICWTVVRTRLDGV